jgi:hypothetical protein
VPCDDVFGCAPGAVVFRRGRPRGGFGESGPAEAVAGRQNIAPVRLLGHPGLVRCAGTAWYFGGPLGRAGGRTSLGPGVLPLRGPVLAGVRCPAGAVQGVLAAAFLAAGFRQDGAFVAAMSPWAGSKAEGKETTDRLETLPSTPPTRSRSAAAARRARVAGDA